ncbi:MAG: FAD-linked oxidase C-terminal domain-containing protein [Chloroflexota bacterium]
MDIIIPSELNHALRQAIQGRVRFDRLSRYLYSTDASSYQVVPAGVIIPRHADDVAAAIELAARFRVPIVPRGGGSSLSGQAIGTGLVLDHSRHLDRILELNPAERWVRVEAGITLDRVNAALLPHGLMVGPDPASAVMATLGGMAGNNSTGTHSIKYGLMVDHVQEVEVVLADGSRERFGPQTPAALASLSRQATLTGSLYRELPRLIDRYRDDIAGGYPKTWRNVAGYNLNRLLADRDAGRPFNLAPLIVGSEGTLVNIVSLTVGVVPRPRYSRLLVLHYDDLRTPLESVPLILENEPAAVEMLSQFFIRLTRLNREFGPRLNRFVSGDPRAVLIVELAGDEAAALPARAAALVQKLQRRGYRGAINHCVTPEEIANLWTVRKATLGLLMSQRGDAKPLSFADDAAVPVEHLADYALAVEQACRAAGVEASLDAHVSAGCLHITPSINLKTAEGLRQLETLSQAIIHTALKYNGTSTGEHGEGLARSYYNEQVYGSRLHQAFREVKGLFDPHNLLNPGKIIDGPLPWQPEVLRLNPQYQTPLAPAETYLDFTADGGLAGLVEMCNGQGFCRQRDIGVMCPSFRATRDEQHSTRGRANALRAALSGQLGPQGMSSRALYEALDLCLECKACRRECPSLVDMAKLKYEFLAQYQAKYGVPLRSRIFGHVATLNRLASLAPGLANWTYRNGLFRRLLDRLVGIEARRGLPPLAPRTFQRWFAQRPSPPPARRGPVILWDDTYLTYNEPEIGQAAVRILEAAGFEVRLIADRQCCGRPMISKGLLDDARRHAAHNVERLLPFVAQGIPIIGLEPSCIAAFRDEYPDLLRSDAARQVAAHSFFIEEFLADLAEQGELNLPFVAPARPRQVLVHGHCYQKALPTTSPLLAMLRLLSNTCVEEIPSGCCGMAGSFGYEKEHYDVSLACGEERLFPAIRAAGEETIIAAAGTSCRQQIFDGTGRRAVHPIIVLAEALG